MTKFRDVPRHEHRIFFSDAQEWLESAPAAADLGNNNVAVSNCVHGAINAVDAMTIFHVGKRSVGSHTDALNLVEFVLAGRERADLARQYNFLPSKKNPAEYGGVKMTVRRVVDSLKCAERILARARAEIEKVGPCAPAMSSAKGGARPPSAWRAPSGIPRFVPPCIPLRAAAPPLDRPPPHLARRLFRA